MPGAFLLPILMKPKLVLSVVFITAIVGSILYGMNYVKGLAKDVENYKEQLKIEKSKNSVLSSEIQNKKEIVNKIEENIQKIEIINKNLTRRIENNNILVRNLRKKLDSTDFEALLSKDPETVSRIFSDAWKRRLECIEVASGRKDVECIE